MKREKGFKTIIKAVSSFFAFFLVFAFVITCSTMLFVTILSDTLGITLTDENVGVAAKLTFGNAVFISLIFTVVDLLRRKYTVYRPV